LAGLAVSQAGSSWQMVLVGDPLYNLFKSRSLLDESQLPERLRPKKP
jgi:hypothetical protein